MIGSNNEERVTILYKNLLKPILFKFNPEKAHHLTFQGLDIAAKTPGMLSLLDSLYNVKESPLLAQKLWGIPFKHPLGLAAGLDKNAEAVPGFSAVGFAFMEVGTVTPKPQSGNEQPRLFRLPEDQALINRMGFNNHGTSAMAERLSKLYNKKIPIAVNIGKNKFTDNAQAADDYVTCIQELYSYGDFFVVNISSPNTPDLRKLQHGDELKQLLITVKREMELQQKKHQDQGKPILVKIAPDLSYSELDQILDVVLSTEMSGIIATNTTLSREGLKHSNQSEIGGLSGSPLKAKSTEIIRYISSASKGQLPIIGSGGIFTAEDAYEKICAGACMVEIYTSLIYQGPGIIRDIHKGLIRLLQQDGFSHISEAIGRDI